MAARELVSPLLPEDDHEAAVLKVVYAVDGVATCVGEDRGALARVTEASK
jgi:hypothetical protein